MCITSKLQEHIICSQIRSHVDEYEVLSPFQHEFRGKHSCECQLTVTYQHLARLNDHIVQVDIGILDFSKVFNVIRNCMLLSKNVYGINKITCNWIQYFFAGCHQNVIVDGVFSKKDSVDSGVPQGKVLGPLLFFLFINDIPNNLCAGTTIRLFADDCFVYRPIKPTEDHPSAKLPDYTRELDHHIGMSFNPSNCNILRTRPGSKNNAAASFYTLHTQILTAKYLGVLILNEISWSPPVDKKYSTQSQSKAGLYLPQHER